MPLIEGDASQRIRNTHKLLFAAATVMAVLLLGRSIVTAALIEPYAFEKGGEANGRGLAFLAHRYLGDALEPHMTSAQS